MILLFLQGQAVRTGSREIELGRSLSVWMERMGIAWEAKQQRQSGSKQPESQHAASSSSGRAVRQTDGLPIA